MKASLRKTKKINDTNIFLLTVPHYKFYIR